MSATEKQRLRRIATAIRRNLTAEFRRQADAAICARVSGLIETVTATAVAAYVSDGTEPDLQVFIEEFSRRGGTVFLPRSIQTANGLEYEMAATAVPGDLVRGAYGIMEPSPGCRTATAQEMEMMLWLVPGVAFDLAGRRLGRGKGFYDRLLQRGNGFKVGIFYECQQMETIPVEPHDHFLKAVVTENMVYRF